MITPAQLDEYRIKGFVAIPGLLAGEPTLIADLRDAYDRELSSPASGFHNIASPSAVGQAPDQGGEVMLQRMNMCEVSMEFRRLLYHPAILDAAEQLMESADGIQLFHDQALFKPALDPATRSFGGNMQWHQDNSYWRCQPANLISAWLALDDITENNGAMRMLPDSWSTPLEGIPMPAGHREDGDAYRREHIDPLFDVSLAETLAPLPAGSVIFHSCRCLHSSLPNRSNRQRRAHVMHLMQPGTTGHDGAVLVRSQAICRCLRFLDLF